MNRGIRDDRRELDLRDVGSPTTEQQHLPKDTGCPERVPLDQVGDKNRDRDNRLAVVGVLFTVAAEDTEAIQKLITNNVDVFD